jgi:hypothetical protein
MPTGQFDAKPERANSARFLSNSMRAEESDRVPRLTVASPAFTWVALDRTALPLSQREQRSTRIAKRYEGGW